MGGYSVTKTYGHERGLSCCFRQHRATSHCSRIHGYALSFAFEFASNALDERGWVTDFGSLACVKQFLEDSFDHKMLIASDDPVLANSVALSVIHLAADVVMLPAVGCEAFAAYAGEAVAAMIENGDIKGGEGLRLVSCTVREHPSNQATYWP